jgi:hypothetical protein
MSPALPTPRDLPTGLDRCAEALVAGSDVVVLAGGEGARRLYTRVAALVAQTGAEVTTLVADNDAGATALGEAAAGARVALLASGPEWTPRTLPSLRALARVRRAVQLVVPAHGDETGEDLPVDELADATRLLDAPLCVGLVARAEQLGAATAAMSLHARDMGRPCATVFSLHNVGLRRLDGPPEPCEVGSAVSMLGDVGAPFAVLGAGEDLAPVLARAKSAGVGPLRAVRVDRLRPGLLPALTEALQGVQTVWVLESLPGVLGDEGWLTLLTHRATQGSARVVPVLRGHDEALFALDEPDARDLTLLPLPARRRLDLAGLKVSLAAWQSLELVVRAALTRFPVDLAGDLDDFAAAVRAHCDAVGHPAAEMPPAARPWDAPAALESLRARASSLNVALDAVAWASLAEPARFALAHLASPRRELARFHAALRATGLCPR